MRSLQNKFILVSLTIGIISTTGIFSEEGTTKNTTHSKSSSENTTQLKPQTTCPVMGGAIDKSLYVDNNGKRIYVCCKMCIPEITKDFEKYAKKLEKMGQSVETIASTTSSETNQLTPQTLCPIMESAIDKKLFVDHKGKRIYVCCAMCIKEVAKDPEKYIKKLQHMGQSVETIPEKK